MTQDLVFCTRAEPALHEATVGLAVFLAAAAEIKPREHIHTRAAILMVLWDTCSWRRSS